MAKKQFELGELRKNLKKHSLQNKASEASYSEANKQSPSKQTPNQAEQASYMQSGSEQSNSEQEEQLFKEAVRGIKPLEQDSVSQTHTHLKQARTLREKNRQQKNRSNIDTNKANERKRINAAFQFSDGFEAWFDSSQPLKFSRSKTLSGEVKRLRRGEYPPDITLDLHGYNREDAKWEIAQFLHTALKHHHYCVCIVHGIGSRVLKQQIPNWLVQHPDVLGFHEAPLEWGGKGALLILLDVKDPLLEASRGR